MFGLNVETIKILIKCCLVILIFTQLFSSTLVYRIEEQAQINVQVGEFLRINKRAVRNKLAGETSCKKCQMYKT